MYFITIENTSVTPETLEFRVIGYQAKGQKAKGV